MVTMRVGVLATLLMLAGCYRWSAPLSPTAPVLARMRGGDVQVTPQSGQVFRLVNARITADTLRGDALANGISGDVAYQGRVAIPVADVRSIAFRQFSFGRTAVAAGVFAGATWVVVSAVTGWLNGCLVLCGGGGGAALTGF